MKGRFKAADISGREDSEHATRAQIIQDFYAAPDQARFGQSIVALVIGYSEAWVERARWMGNGPAFVRLGGTTSTAKNGRTQIFGGRVFYIKRDVVAWLNTQHPVQSTSQY